MRSIVLVLLLAGVAPAFALDVHPDRRFVSASCWTWGNGKYKSVTGTLRATFTWDTAASNYPVGMVAQAGCVYVGEMGPVAGVGEEVATCANCYAKTVIPKGETMPRTSWPVLTIGYTTDFNEGWSYHQCWCKWDPWAYGGTPVPTTTTTTLP
jgi:hypothetical protein